MKKFFQAYQASTLKLSNHVKILYLAYRDPRVPLRAKLLMRVVIGYALSPIDLIPDFIPVLGVIDDLLVVPVGIYWCFQLIPEEVVTDAQAGVEELTLKKSIWSGIAVVLIWILIIGWFIYKIFFFTVE